MTIVPIEFHIAAEDLTKLSPEDVETSIKAEIIQHITDSISLMLDSEDFINMIPNEDGSGYEIEINLLIGSAAEYIDATSLVTSNLLQLCTDQNVSKSDAIKIIQDATQPLIDLVK